MTDIAKVINPAAVPLANAIAHLLLMKGITTMILVVIGQDIPKFLRNRGEKMKLLITGIVIFILPILAWFSSGFVEAVGTTLFFWAIGISMILVALDRGSSSGLWIPPKKPSSKPIKCHFYRAYKFDGDNNIVDCDERLSSK
jgi:hypothetical protein